MINLIKSDTDSSSQSSESSDNQFFLLEDSTSSDSNNSSSQSSCDCVGNCLCQIHQVNMISSENNFLIEIIENIPDQNLQKEYFKKFLEIQKQSNQKKLENNHDYSLKTVLDKFSNKPKTVGIQDLQHEISEIKLQIKTMLEHKTYGNTISLMLATTRIAFLWLPKLFFSLNNCFYIN